MSAQLKPPSKEPEGVVLMTTPETPPQVCKNVVVLNESAWRDNDAFDHLIRQHLVQYNHLGIHKLASSIVRHWIGNHGGRFLDIDHSGEAQTLTDEPRLAIKVGALLRSIQSLPMPEEPCFRAQYTNTHDGESPSQDATISSLSPFDHSLGHIDDEEPKIFDKNVLLPMIPHDIFDQSMPESPPHGSQRQRISLNMKPLERNTEIMESLKLRGIVTIASPENKLLRSSDGNELLTPKIDNTTETKKQGIGAKEAQKEDKEPPTRDPEMSPPKKRLKKSVAFDDDTKPPRNQSQPIASAITPTLSPLLTSQESGINTFTNNDVVFAGMRARNHKGNMLFNEWMTRFCKRINAQSNITEIARRIVALFTKLATRFLEAKKSPLEGQTTWVELGEPVVVERTSVLIQKLLSEKKIGNRSNLDVSNGDCSTILKSARKVHILKIDLKLYQIRIGNDCIKLESNDHDQLWTNDVMLGQHDGRETHYGNLKFFHHIDDFLPKYERATTVGGKLNVIRQIISAWKRQVAKEVRFIVRNGDVYSIVGADDELTVFLGVGEMIQEIMRPIPLGSSDIYLGDKWTIQRTHQRNREYFKRITSNMAAFSEASTITSYQRRTLEELNIAGDVIRTVCWESYPTGRFRGGLKVFDTKLQDWVLVSVEEAVKRTLVMLRLKAYFSGIPARAIDPEGPNNDGGAANLPAELAQHIAALVVISPRPEVKHTPNQTAPPTSKSSNKRPGATRPIPSPLRAALRASPKGSINFASLLQSELWSPTESPEKSEYCRRPMTPISPVPSKFLVADIPSTRAAALTSVVHPIALHSMTQPGLVSEAIFHPLHSWVPTSCDAKIIPESPQIDNEHHLHPFFHGGFIPQHPNSTAFWPPHPSRNDGLFEYPMPRNPGHMAQSFPVPNPNHRMVWLPISSPNDARITDAT